MKTVEETKTGLPSFEPEWPRVVEERLGLERRKEGWRPDPHQREVQSSSWENAWRGFQGYDSPLAG